VTTRNSIPSWRNNSERRGEAEASISGGKLICKPGYNLLTFSEEVNCASNSATDPPCPGKTRSGAISANGSRTNRRRWARGCGSVNSGVARISLLNAIKSRSSGRASFRTFLGMRPNSFSSVWSFLSKDSGVSLLRGASPTTAFTKFGEPGGQSTGALSKSDDFRSGWSDNSCNRSIACKIRRRESPRFEPNAMNAFCRTLLQPQHILHIVDSRLLRHNPLGGT